MPNPPLTMEVCDRPFQLGVVERWFPKLYLGVM